jgi:sugar O-acyltransferase (sialic acid O-acetyltransferase NeuD family)
MKKKVVIFGLKDMAQLARFYFEYDSEYQPVAFAVDKQYKDRNEFDGLPVYDFENIESHFSPKEFSMFVPMTQQKMGKLREEKYLQAKKKGYSLATYISSKATYYGTPVGENTFIFEDNTIQPYTQIGNNVCFWSGNHFGHSSVAKDHVFLTSNVVISGHVVIEPYCFFGVNSTVRDAVKVAEGSLVAMGAVISKDTQPYGVYFGGKQTLKEGVTSLDVM